MRLSTLRSPARAPRARTPRAGSSRVGPAPAALPALAVLACLTLAGCSGETASETDEVAASASPSASESESPSLSPSPTVTLGPSGTVSGNAGEKPAERPSRKPATRTASPAPTGLVVDVTVRGDEVSPQAEVLEADIDKPLTLQIDSDRAGEMHVHSSPEQYVDFGPGSTTAEIRFENPGVIDVEEHDTGALVLKVLVQ